LFKKNCKYQLPCPNGLLSAAGEWISFELELVSPEIIPLLRFLGLVKPENSCKVKSKSSLIM
jgi:hypothetical protein